MVAKAAERTMRAVEKRIVFKERERAERVSSGRLEGRRLVGCGMHTKEAFLYPSLMVTRTGD